MIFNDLYGRLDMGSCVFEITTDKGTQKTEITEPLIMLAGKFADLVQQAANTNEPVTIKASRTVPVLLDNNQNVERELFAKFINKAYESKYGIKEE